MCTVVVIAVGAIIAPEAVQWFCNYRVGYLKHQMTEVETSMNRCLTNHTTNRCFDLQDNEYFSKFSSDFLEKLHFERIENSKEIKLILHNNVGCHWTDPEGNEGTELVLDAINEEFRAR